MQMVPDELSKHLTPNARALNNYDKMKLEVTNYISLQVPSINMGVDVRLVGEMGGCMGRHQHGDRGLRLEPHGRGHRHVEVKIDVMGYDLNSMDGDVGMQTEVEIYILGYGLNPKDGGEHRPADLTASATIAWDIDAIDASGGQPGNAVDTECRAITVDSGAETSVAPKRMVEDGPLDDRPNLTSVPSGELKPIAGPRREVDRLRRNSRGSNDELPHRRCDEAFGVNVKDLRQGQPRGV